MKYVICKKVEIGFGTVYNMKDKMDKTTTVKIRHSSLRLLRILAAVKDTTMIEVFDELVKDKIKELGVNVE